MTDEEFVDCPRCGHLVELFDGRLASHDAGWHLGAPPCPAGRQTPADARDAVAVDQMFVRMRGLLASLPPRIERCEMHPAAWETLFRQRPSSYSGDPLGLGPLDKLLGVPLVVRDALAAGTWRALDCDGQVVAEGALG